MLYGIPPPQLLFTELVVINQPFRILEDYIINQCHQASIKNKYLSKSNNNNFIIKIPIRTQDALFGHKET